MTGEAFLDFPRMDEEAAQSQDLFHAAYIGVGVVPHLDTEVAAGEPAVRSQAGLQR
jgi:hypothetical protein